MRALVTGHLGYIGGNFIKTWETLGHTWVGYDFKEDKTKDLSEGIDEDFINHKNNPIDIVFHFAAIPNVELSIVNPKYVMKNNIVSTSIILEWARKNDVPVVYSSSSAVVGNGHGPESPYGLSKLVGEQETLMYYKLYGLKTVALRYFNVYSYDQSADSDYASVICNWKKFILSNRIPFITGTGDQTRDLIHVDDIVLANVFCADNLNNDSLWGKWYDIGSGESVSLNQIKEIVKENFPELKFEYVADRPGDVLHSRSDLEKFKSHGWRSSINYKDGLNSVFQKIKKDVDNSNKKS